MGIGLGVPLRLIAVAGVAYLGYRYGKMRAGSAAPPAFTVKEVEEEEEVQEVYEVDGSAEKRLELVTKANIAEMPADSHAQELESSR